MSTVPLRDVVSVRGGGTPRKSVPSYYGGDVPWVTPKDMKRPVIGSSEITLTSDGVKNSSAKVVPAGAVLVVIRSGVLKHTLPVALTNQPVTVNQDMKALIPTHRLDAAYLARLLKALQPRVLTWVRATTADNFPIDKLLDLKIKLPPVDEQRRIAAILDHADALRAKRHQIVAHLRILTESIFHDMFGDAAWTSTLGELAEVQIGPFGSLLHQGDYVAGGVPVLNPMHIREGQLVPDHEFAVTEEKAASLPLYRLRPGDVVLGRRGEMGRAGIATTMHDGMLCGTGSLILRASGGDSTYLHAVVTSQRMKSHLERNSLGVTLPNLNSGIVKASPAPDVPLETQRLFAQRIARVREVVLTTQRTATNENELFVSLQSRAFRGDL